MVKNLPAVQGTRLWSLGQEDPLEKEMAIHSSILAWKIPWTEELGRLQSMGSQRVRNDWATSLNYWKVISQASLLFSKIVTLFPSWKYTLNNVEGQVQVRLQTICRESMQDWKTQRKQNLVPASGLPLSLPLKWLLPTGWGVSCAHKWLPQPTCPNSIPTPLKQALLDYPSCLGGHRKMQ